MNLKDGVRRVRSKFGEGRAWLLPTSDVIADLNRSARSFFSYAQALQKTYAGLTVAPTSTTATQEYILPDDVDQVIKVKVQVGILMPVVMATKEDLQQGAYISSLPLSAYVYRGQSTVSMIPVPPNDPPAVQGGSELVNPPPNTLGKVYWILGFMPVPAAVYPFFVDYNALHPEMKFTQDMCLLPDTADYFDAWTSYAIAAAFDRAQDSASADRYMQIFKAGVEQFKTDSLVNRAQIMPPTYGGLDANPMFNRGPFCTCDTAH